MDYSFKPERTRQCLIHTLNEPYQMTSQSPFEAPVSPEEAQNQYDEILRLREEFTVKNPYARNGEAMDWAIESYFKGVRSNLAKAMAMEELPSQLEFNL